MKKFLTVIFLGFQLAAVSQVEFLLKINQPPSLEFAVSGNEISILAGNSEQLGTGLIITG